MWNDDEKLEGAGYSATSSDESVVDVLMGEKNFENIIDERRANDTFLDVQ